MGRRECSTLNRPPQRTDGVYKTIEMMSLIIYTLRVYIIRVKRDYYPKRMESRALRAKIMSKLSLSSDFEQQLEKLFSISLTEQHSLSLIQYVSRCCRYLR